MLTGLICLVAGSVLGGSARYFVSGIVARHIGETFPWGTMAVNVTGAFIIGVFGALASDSASLMASPDPWLFAVTGGARWALAIPAAFIPPRSCAFRKTSRLSSRSSTARTISEDNINRFLPALDSMMSSGLITLEKVQVLQYGEKAAS